MQGVRPGGPRRPGSLASTPDVLLIGYAADADLLTVSALLDLAGIPNLLWRYDATADDVTVDARPGAFRIQHGEVVLTSEDFARARVVVHRTGLGRWGRPVAAPDVNGPERDFTEREWTSLLHGLFLEAEQRHRHLTWLNAPSVSAATAAKYHLVASADLDGLTVPDLRISTDGHLPRSASGQYVAKAIGEDESIDDATTYCTAVLDTETLDELPFRTSCPSLIQERVLAEYELRVYYLLGDTLAIRIQVARSDYADLRLVPREHWSARVTAIAPELHDALRRYCERRRLAYCVFDFLRTAEGRDLLIDVTPSGTWSHLESPGEPTIARWYAGIVAGALRSAEMAIVGLDHVQVSITPGGEDAARRFYGGVLGMPELAKPGTLAGRGGVWFACGDQQLHCGVEAAAAPSRRHPALRTDDLDALRARLEAAGFPIRTDAELPGYRRFYTEDPFGNRLECMERIGE